MTIASLTEKLRNIGIAQYGNVLSKSEIESLFTSNNILLPESHIELLESYNGISVYGGYYRIFGMDPKSQLNLLKWNEESNWKFAWGNKVDDYLCFGETAWGDQYAYKLSDLPNSKVYFIDAIEMIPEVIADSFTEFLEIEFLTNATAPYDDVLVDVRRSIGDIGINEHIIYSPSPLLGGEETASNVQKMNMTTAMIFNGDLCRQLAHESQQKQVKKINVYSDELGRNRLEVVWL